MAAEEAPAAEPKKNTFRRDFLIDIEVNVQKQWEQLKVFECDHGKPGEEKFMCTFPYPYMNGLFHIGHAYTLTKAIFAAHYNRLLGKKVLFPFGFHCTGMPIQAAANKLKKEYVVYGGPHPTFPPGKPMPQENEDGNVIIDAEGVQLRFKCPGSTGNKNVKVFHLMMKVGDGEFKKLCEIPPPSAEELAQNKGKIAVKAKTESGADCIYKVRYQMADGTWGPDSAESEAVNVDAPKAAGNKQAGPRVAKKILAKTGDATFQFEILKAMHLDMTVEEMTRFEDPLFWLEYFPPLGMRDLKRFGSPIDFRRSFITTSVNPYYDRFVSWQFNKLKAGDKIGFGKRPTMYSETDGQACMDHDRAEGEGVPPQEYTAIKVELVEFPTAMKKLKDKKVFLLAATLRPETMPGQTNCWILPEGVYGCYQGPKDSVYVTSHRAARNMSFQDILMPRAKPTLLQEVTGKDLMGCKVKCPTAKYEICHLLPLLTIKMDKGTGIVTSVPSDSPDDYAAFMDLMKPAKRDYYGIKAEWVEPFKLVPIIDVEIDGEIRALAAEYMCEKLGVTSQKDKEKLHEAHDVCYKLGFDKGIMSNGPFKGKPVKEAKLLFGAQMRKDDQAFLYSEPEKRVVGRSGDECVVAGIDQWYLKYGEASWRGQIEQHLNSDNFVSYNARIKESFQQSFGWLKEWACSRSFGLGTKVPWDQKFVIESLSDSTIYMAYYTCCHFLQDKALDGSKGGSGGIKPEQVTDEVFDFIFLKGPMPKTSIKTETLEKMRAEFRFWYPMDLRVSGKDLIQNHLTMSLYNHACVWKDEPDLWPRGFFCNGMTMVDGEKMSKSKGNFFTLADLIKMYGADAVRIACANTGDTLEDGNFELDVATTSIMKMYNFIDTVKSILSGAEPLDEKASGTFLDGWFANEMNRLAVESKGFYDAMLYKQALRTSWSEFLNLFGQYRDVCTASKRKMNKALIMRYLEWQLIMVTPVAPHFCEHCWELLGKKGSVLNARWPEPTAPVDSVILTQGVYIFDKVKTQFFSLKTKASKNGVPTAATVYVAKEFAPWKVKVLAQLRAIHAKGELPLSSAEEFNKSDVAKAQWKAVIGDLMKDPELKPFGKFLGPFAAFKRDECYMLGESALSASALFDEMTLLKEMRGYVGDKLEVEVEVRLAEDVKSKEHADAAAQAQPGQPGIFFYGSAGGGGGGAPKAKAKAAGKAEAKAAGKPAGKAAPGGKSSSTSSAPIKDLKAFNEHMTTRSYFEGGGLPTAADRGQLEALPKGDMVAEQYPHAARWQRHMLSFKKFQRDSW